MNRPLLILAATMVAAPVLAQSQTSMTASAGRQAQAADKALNDQYRIVMERLSPPSRPLLRDAQRSWIGFRDKQCAFETSGARGGSAYAMVHAGCLARLSQERTRQLASAGRCQEGDLTCPR